MESEGAGVQLLMAADVALEMGVPIYAVVAGAYTATDREGRSVPAPGKGILSTAREAPSSSGPSPLLNVEFRRSQFDEALTELNDWKERQSKTLSSEFVSREYSRRYRALQATFGSDFHVQDPTIAPLRGCLAEWGLTIDDLAVCSFHGTGTKANDRNESSVVDAQMKALGRTRGRPLYSIFQKYLTGHPKGAAAAWMTNGVIQTLRDQIVPGNRNADNVDNELSQFEHLLFSDRTLNVPSDVPIRAAYLHSFGFGQASAEIVLVHADLVFAAMTESQQQRYERVRFVRQQRASRHLANAICGKTPLMTVKNDAPYAKHDTEDVYLNPHWRLNALDKTESDKTEYVPSKAPRMSENRHLLDALELSSLRVEGAVAQQVGVGVDVENVADFREKDDVFVGRNFVENEVAYINGAASRIATLTGRWCAKEAVLKAISSLASPQDRVLQSSGAPLKDIEIVATNNGAPRVQLHGAVQKLAESLKVASIVVSISHTDEHAIAQAIATRHSTSNES